MSRRIIVLGAGITGLAVCWFLKKTLQPDDSLTLIESADRPGGWIQTINQEGYLFEQGPRSCRTKGSGRETLALIEELGLQNEVIIPCKDAEKRFIFNGSKLLPLPNSLLQVFYNPLTRGWLKALWSDLTQPKGKNDESVRDFFTRRLGPAWMESIIDPFVLGIYAGDCSHLSVESCFPTFNEWEKNSGSLLRGALGKQPPSLPQTPFIQSVQRQPIFSFKNGMETVTNALATSLKDNLKLKTKAVGLQPCQNGIKVLLSTGQSLHADSLISTLPAHALSPLLPSLASHLNRLRYSSVLVVNLGFKSMASPHKGFGYLVPSALDSPLLGCVWDSSIFPEHNQDPSQTRWTLMLGGMKHPEILSLKEDKIIDLSLAALRQQCGLKQMPHTIQIKPARLAIPQFELGYQEWKSLLMEKIEGFSPHLTLSGSSFTGVSINDCILHARLLADRLLI